MGGKAAGSHLPPSYSSVSFGLTPPNSLSTPSRMSIPIRPSPARPVSPPLSAGQSLPAAMTRGAQAPMVAPPLARSISATSNSSDKQAAARIEPILPLINSVFPHHASDVAEVSHMLEIVTPPDHVLQGFVSDTTDPDLGRIVFVYLPPTHQSAPARPDHLAPHFSDILRPHDPHRPHPVSSPKATRAPMALDIRESLTALLDLADTIEAGQLLLILDKDERDPAPLAELMHALMYVGGQPISPRAAVGQWEWDSRRWALVNIEL